MASSSAEPSVFADPENSVAELVETEDYVETALMVQYNKEFWIIMPLDSSIMPALCSYALGELLKSIIGQFWSIIRQGLANIVYSLYN